MMARQAFFLPGAQLLKAWRQTTPVQPLLLPALFCSLGISSFAGS
jgi:hypothetical protein